MIENATAHIGHTVKVWTEQEFSHDETVIGENGKITVVEPGVFQAVSDITVWCSECEVKVDDSEGLEWIT